MFRTFHQCNVDWNSLNILYNVPSLTGCAWEFQNNALWDTKYGSALLVEVSHTDFRQKLLNGMYCIKCHHTGWMKSVAEVQNTKMSQTQLPDYL